MESVSWNERYESITPLEYRDFLYALTIVRKRLALYYGVQQSKYLSWLCELSRKVEYQRLKGTLTKSAMCNELEIIFMKDKEFLEEVQYV